jgi:hypothetical protein
MTMVAACHFADGAVIIADSRATWVGPGVPIFQDELQKILPLGPKIGLAFAGDVAAAALIARQLRQRLRKDEKARALRKLAADVPRIARHYYSIYKARTGKDHGLQLILCGATESRRVGVWWFESPHFDSHKLENGFVVVGSGSIVAAYLKSEMERIARDAPDLKARADMLLVGLEGALQGKDVDTVGGLFQIILVDQGGIRPLRYGFLDLDPELPARAKTMEMVAGRWTQSDLATGETIPLIKPARLLSAKPHPLRVHDLEPPTVERQIPKWHLTYFILSIAAEIGVGILEFTGTIGVVGARQYPLSGRVLANIGLWGAAGDHELVFALEQNGVVHEVHRERIRIEYFPEEANFAVELPLEIADPGITFLVCKIGDQLLGRYAVYFGRLASIIPESQWEFQEFAKEQLAILEREQRDCSDPVVESSGAVLVHFFLCQEFVDDGMKRRCQGQMASVYWKTYPLQLRVFLATAFRMTRGKHAVRVELVNAATRAASVIASATVESTSSCRVTPVQGEVIALVPAPGWYFVNVHIDDRLVGTMVLAAETDECRFSYTLPKESVARIGAGELIVLLKRSQPQPRDQRK